MSMDIEINIVKSVFLVYWSKTYLFSMYLDTEFGQANKDFSLITSRN